MALVKLLGNTLVDKDGTKHDVADLSKAKAVGLYFSAHWCPPCRMFTPQLAKTYETLKQKGLQVVFISSDRDESSFNEYLGEMPWLAVPYADRDLKKKLSAKFKVSGIPTFIIVDPETGKLLNKDGRASFLEDPQGNNLLWKSKTFLGVIGNEFVNKSGNKVTYDEFKDKTLGIYFSAHWCPPCRMFTPVLAAAYNALKAQHKNFEVIFVNSDRDDHSYKEYLGEMPWWAVPFTDQSRLNALSELFGVEGIPTFVLVHGATGEVLNAHGREAVLADKECKNFPWAPKPVNELNGSTAMALNEGPGIIAFVDDADETNVVKALEAAAKKYEAEHKGSDDGNKISFFYAKGHELVKRVKELVKYDGSSALYLADLPQEVIIAGKAPKIDDVTEETVAALISAYESRS